MVCGTCGRPVCGEHLASSSPPECAECAARRPEVKEQAAARRRVEPFDDPYQYYGYRDWLWYDQFQDDRIESQGSDEQLEDSQWDTVGDIAGDDFDDGDGGDFGDS